MSLTNEMEKNLMATHKWAMETINHRERTGMTLTMPLIDKPRLGNTIAARVAISVVNSRKICEMGLTLGIRTGTKLNRECQSQRLFLNLCRVDIQLHCEPTHLSQLEQVAGLEYTSFNVNLKKNYQIGLVNSKRSECEKVPEFERIGGLDAFLMIE
jgi:hypothetical protein